MTLPINYNYRPPRPNQRYGYGHAANPDSTNVASSKPKFNQEIYDKNKAREKHPVHYTWNKDGEMVPNWQNNNPQSHKEYNDKLIEDYRQQKEFGRSSK